MHLNKSFDILCNLDSDARLLLYLLDIDIDLFNINILSANINYKKMMILDNLNYCLNSQFCNEDINYRLD